MLGCMWVSCLLSCSRCWCLVHMDDVPITWRYWLSYVLCLDYIEDGIMHLWSVAGPLMSGTIGSCGCILLASWYWMLCHCGLVVLMMITVVYVSRTWICTLWLMHCISVDIFAMYHHVSADAVMIGTRLSDVMQGIFLFFTAPRSEPIWCGYDQICIAWYMPFRRIGVTEFLL